MKTAPARTVAGLLLGLALLLGGGCIHIESTLTLNADGSGRLRYVYGMTEQNITQMEAMRGLAMQMDKAQQGKNAVVATNDDLTNPFPFDEPSVRKALLPYESEGVKIESLKIAPRDNLKCVELNLTFKDFASLTKTQFFGQTTFALTKLDDGNYRLSQQILADAEPVDMVDVEVAKNVAPILAGLKVLVTINVPGRILETNAQRRSDRALLWDVDFDKEPQSLRKHQREGAYVVFDGKALKRTEGTASAPAEPANTKAKAAAPAP